MTLHTNTSFSSGMRSGGAGNYRREEQESVFAGRWLV
jgi:hypothetical protein